MVDLIKRKEGELMTTSKIIAEVFGKAHRKVLRDIDVLDCSDEFREANFGLSSYTSPQNKNIKCFDITRDGFAFLCMGFTGKKAAEWKEKYIKAFNEMENAAKKSISVMAEINKAISIMEGDRAIAQKCGKGLSMWKRLKKEHEESVQILIDKSQMVLGLEQLAEGKNK